MGFLDACCMWLIRELSTRGDRIPETFQVAGAVGIGTNKAGTGPNSRSRRLAECAAGYWKKPAQAILLLGGNGYPKATESEAMWAAIRGQVPECAILLDTLSHDTYTNGVEGLALLKERRYSSVVFFAEAWHARRVRWVFRKIFRESGISVYVVPVICPYDSDSSGRFISPTGFFFYELGAIVYSYFRGWV